LLVTGHQMGSAVQMSDERFHGDQPIHSEDQDRFGFGPLAERIATALTTQAAGKGFVLGVEGKWGSGKSSLLALTLQKLRSMSPEKVAAVEFRPWLIGDRDQLLSALFEDLVKAVASLEHAGGDATGVTKLAVSNVTAKVKKFASHLGPLSKLAGVAGMFVPGASLLGDIVEKIASAAAEQAEGPTLAEQKEDLASALLKLNCRIVVAIDDVDRLEPTEVAELLRLVRSVADFPNISYLLCYDAPTLGKAIEQATGVASGAAYLEKIVQTEVAVPRPESFALRRWFSGELQKFAECDERRVPYLQQVIDETGGRTFDSARAVVRVLDSLRFFWPSLRGRVDLPDLVWLRMIAVGAPSLHRWIEEYLVAYAALSAGRVHISEVERNAVAKRLDKALEDAGLSWKEQRFELERHLPGVKFHTYNNDKDERLFAKSEGPSHFKIAQDRRLASASHSRIYFSLVEPPDSVTELDIVALHDAARDSVNAVSFLLMTMGQEKGDAGASKAEKLLDQLRYVDKDLIHGWPIEAIVMGLANAADTLAADASGDDWGYPRVWYLLKDFLKRLSVSLPEERWTNLIVAVFTSSTSIAFVSYLLRDETFGHGFYGDRPDPNERMTSRETFEVVRGIMLTRYADGGLDVILSERAAATMLYAWSQAGGRGDIIEIINARITDDLWLIEFIHKLFSKSSSTDGTYDSLSIESLNNFFKSPAEIVRKIIALASKDPPAPGAAAIVAALKRSIHFDGGDFEQVVQAWEERERSESQAGEE
jgi:hypothetical protein